MTSRTRFFSAAAALLVGLAGPAMAGPARARPAVPRELAVEGQVGYFGMAASNTASAIFDSTGGVTFGAAGRYTFHRSFFVSVGLRTFSKDGQRVFVSSPGGAVSKLGFPLSVRITPIFATVGYRFRNGQMLVPYAGLGLSITGYKETSEVAGQTFEESRSKAGFHGLAGLEVGRHMFRFGGELSYSTVPDAIGIAGVSKVYGEKNLGGLSVLGKVIVVFGAK
jgi:opacity protein-like surface antigen